MSWRVVCNRRRIGATVPSVATALHEKEGFVNNLTSNPEHREQVAKWAEENAHKTAIVAVESGWDDQAVGRVLGVPLGASIRKSIMPGIMTLKAENERMNAMLHMAVDRLGGTVESAPTQPLNFLQRIDELVDKEKQAQSMSELLCPVHAALDSRNELEPFDNCIACIRNQRDELLKALKSVLAFAVDEFECRKNSYLPDDGEDYAQYVKPAEDVVALIRAATE